MLNGGLKNLFFCITHLVSLYYPPFTEYRIIDGIFWDAIAEIFSIFAFDIIWAVTGNIKATGDPHRPREGWRYRD